MKKRASIITLILFVFSFCFQIKAYATSSMSPIIGSYRLLGGLTNRYYYMDSSAQGYYDSYSGRTVDYREPIKLGMITWNNAGTRVSFTHTYNKPDSSIDVYVGNFGPYYDGKTSFSAGGPLMDIPTANWKWAEVYLNGEFLNLGNNVARDIQRTAMHEFGHCFGLAENYNDRTSVMCQDCYPIPAAPNQADRNAINYMYK